jgi:hypothetical protein
MIDKEFNSYQFQNLIRAFFYAFAAGCTFSSIDIQIFSFDVAPSHLISPLS